MGWRGYKGTIDVGMLFRKMYCHKCGNILKRKKVSNIYKKGEPGYVNTILGSPTIGMDRIELVEYIYHCPNCSSEITYDEQCIVAKKQKRLKKRILVEKD